MVFPLPRNPVKIVTGIRASAVAPAARAVTVDLARASAARDQVDDADGVRATRTAARRAIDARVVDDRRIARVIARVAHVLAAAAVVGGGMMMMTIASKSDARRNEFREILMA